LLQKERLYVIYRHGFYARKVLNGQVTLRLIYAASSAVLFITWNAFI